MPWEKQFNRDEALKRAVRLFWKAGYESSSMAMLLKAMGIQKGSFYATFRSKHDILMEALDHYVITRFAGFRAHLEGLSPLEALRKHLNEVVQESTGTERSAGCFLVNCALELAPRDRQVREVVKTTLEAHAKFYESLLDEAKKRGELPAHYDSAARSQALLGLVLGMRVLARGGLPAEPIRALHQQANELLAVAP
jgi:TetR/AcrR family transcriptional regulator, transcriptional repressor for nem operon